MPSPMPDPFILGFPRATSWILSPIVGGLWGREQCNCDQYSSDQRRRSDQWGSDQHSKGSALNQARLASRGVAESNRDECSQYSRGHKGEREDCQLQDPSQDLPKKIGSKNTGPKKTRHEKMGHEKTRPEKTGHKKMRYEKEAHEKTRQNKAWNRGQKWVCCFLGRILLVRWVPLVGMVSLVGNESQGKLNLYKGFENAREVENAGEKRGECKNKNKNKNKNKTQLTPWPVFFPSLLIQGRKILGAQGNPALVRRHYFTVSFLSSFWSLSFSWVLPSFGGGAVRSFYQRVYFNQGVYEWVYESGLSALKAGKGVFSCA
ncbi:hypothetical protein JGUZn3_11160 [Entomobacter blattae]|uniref:Uncharacterized protein n=2 Tax=Entomobacter blattae TaxID=2762277 RepID=A0A7H1NRD3_9PROT|nr:hypothetical protein JGUZn3_11160 [Entomobacter blattae]